MRILSVKALSVPDMKAIRVARFRDERGYFTEVMRESDMLLRPELHTLSHKHFEQVNESISEASTVRGLHLQVDPNIDKFLRVLTGHVIDFAVDIRPQSPTFGRVCAYELRHDPSADYEDMVLIPFGFAHGIGVIEDSRVQYFQTGIWNGAGEVSISPLAPELDWNHMEATHYRTLQAILSCKKMSAKDQKGISLTQWKAHPFSRQF